ncbi:MAG: hypothetical protein ACJZ8Y_02125 [Pirellulaceae bacterium]
MSHLYKLASGGKRMFAILTKPIGGTPNIPATKLGMGLSIATLTPGLSEIVIGLLVTLWIVFIAWKAMVVAYHYASEIEINLPGKVWNAGVGPRLPTPGG